MTGPMPSELDDGDFPIVRMRAHGPTSDEDLDERIAFMDRQLARGHEFALVFDTRRSNLLGAAHRRRWADWVARNEQAMRDRLVGGAILVSSPAGRGVFTAIFWMWKPPVPVVFVNTDEEAEAVVRRQLAEAGVSFP